MHGQHPPAAEDLSSADRRPAVARAVAIPAVSADEAVRIAWLGGTVREARVAHAAVWARVHDTVVALARRLRAEGVAPERMLVLAKAAAQRAAPADLDLLERRELVSDAVRWGVAAYYAA